MLTISIMLDSITAPRQTAGRVTAGPADTASMSEPEFESFYEQWSGPLFGYLHRMTGDHALAEDLAQKAFLRLLGATLKTKNPSALKSYLYKIATNLVYDHWRRGPADSSLAELPTLASEERDRPALRSDMQKLFEELEPRERALLWLAHVEDAPHREIAEILGLKEKSIRVILFRARRKFAEILQAHGYGAPS